MAATTITPEQTAIATAQTESTQVLTTNSKKGKPNPKAGFITQFLSSAVSPKALSTIPKLSPLELARAKKVMDVLNAQFNPLFAGMEEQMKQAVMDYEEKEKKKAAAKEVLLQARTAYKAACQ